MCIAFSLNDYNYLGTGFWETALSCGHTRLLAWEIHSDVSGKRGGEKKTYDAKRSDSSEFYISVPRDRAVFFFICNIFHIQMQIHKFAINSKINFDRTHLRMEV